MPTVLITGANRGLGLEFARQYSADGWNVIGTARQPGDAAELKEIERVHVEQLEMRDLEAVTSFGSRVGARLDLLIANAGTWKPEQATTAEDGRAWAEMLTSNTIAPYFLAKAVLERVAAAGGKMVAISSGLGSIAESSGGYVPYRTSKAALNMAWRQLAIEARPLGVATAVLDPGWVKTRMGGRNAPTTPEESISDMRRVIDGLTLERSGGFYRRDGSAEPW
jgi:NAD(P)-dependent dehydrogenase (short-subunit alcohol dehydrogenase family)